MFVQVIQGHVSDAGKVRALMDRWVAELAPGAVGWLGSTAGVTDEGELVVLARFESEEAARKNSDQPRQTAWWEEMAAQFTDEPVFHNCTEVEVDTPGDPSQATFVQVMQGRTTDMERTRELMAETPEDWARFRPDILGSVWAGHDDGLWTMALYFTSEAEARVNEQKEPPPELAKMIDELASLSAGEPSYLDLREPWLDAPDQG
ncbi:hypothetical protein [Nocardioides sp. TF02-7]|uniref:hypothetical protein n=1 Tax=Nocardioides sp. TF02-7 TaxID=2917724 RepID=UPI001F0570BC|nr:hypothetical protein [Nocardioides sp. TF02-7]UMG91079.1 hypothetical protein MF408_12780 [Nocardioides sp. TF02-7]